MGRVRRGHSCTTDCVPHRVALVPRLGTAPARVVATGSSYNNGEQMMEQLLGFRVVPHNGAWQIQTLNEDGAVTSVRPCLYREVWELWSLATEQHAALSE